MKIAKVTFGALESKEEVKMAVMDTIDACSACHEIDISYILREAETFIKGKSLPIYEIEIPQIKGLNVDDFLSVITNMCLNLKAYIEIDNAPVEMFLDMFDVERYVISF